ncbi:unnamed protein product [Rotaria magnacalcarata]|uniref:Integrator complex subunit 11 n=1 Tax=Rotaria magnacalcarata TaxID=392030 RepID=A0A816X514_9BILA|nr:unnamed protein product [Rotaria magnacalcarata]CAF2117693.1 unnamed protein product [Rotaria magnacalcarata]CAF2141734.1 unnamed protein product [Rotaria magnacalcarata]CAF4056076.1 unnamed protein product [Rotaria magnacalcarata]CAF4139636.1 unnamed protein product [Rotaria magnacalcarata]
MSDIRILPLGAGQDVGRSCILITMGGKNIMLDCGLHMGFYDDRRFPDFSVICKDGPLTPYIHCVIISHFHLDHCGALPYMTEVVGYNGPLYMTYPTKAICPLLLEDFRKVTTDKTTQQGPYTSDDIKNCMKKVIPVSLGQTVKVDTDFEIKAYYAGHVLGAAMFHIRVGQQTLVYTGDFNTTADRHLGSAHIDRCRPDVLITESTYGSTVRDSRRARERDFMAKVVDCVRHGGKVLVPVFAVGRAQELCILLETYLERMNLNVPIYFASGLSEKVNTYYSLFVSWTNEKIQSTFHQKNIFDFKHIKPWDRSYVEQPGAMIVFASPGMLHAGYSLHLFKKWAPDEKNMIIIPGYCVANTVGSKLLLGQRRFLFDGKEIEAKMQVHYMSFSAHADAKGITQIIRQCQPSNVVLVHGEDLVMDFLRGRVQDELKIPCYKPANGETVTISTPHGVPVDIEPGLVQQLKEETADVCRSEKRSKQMRGTLIIKDGRLRLVRSSTAMNELGLVHHTVQFHSRFPSSINIRPITLVSLIQLLERELNSNENESKHRTILISDNLIHIDNQQLRVSIETNGDVDIAWTLNNELLGQRVSSHIKSFIDQHTSTANVIIISDSAASPDPM